MIFDIAVIGGGASGLMASIHAKNNCNSVCILERNDKVGKKLLLTGDGKCNITNKNLDIKHYHSDDINSVKNVLLRFNNIDTINFFYKLGLLTISMPDGRVFPLSMQASSVLDVLRFSAIERNIIIKNGFKAKNIIKSEGLFNVISEDGEKVTAKSIIISTGGAAAPFTGSDGFGYKLAQSFGHSLVKPLPALVQLKLDYPNLKTISGVRLDVNASLYVENKLVESKLGEVLFTEYGASGPVALSFSRSVTRSLNEGKIAYINFCFLPNIGREELINIILDFANSVSNRSIFGVLTGLINKRIAAIVLKDAGIQSMEKKVSDLKKNELERIVENIQQTKMGIRGTLSFRDAQVTSGGIPMKEVNAETLESKIVKGLFFAGEILNVDGESGGYNLQWAWSSAFVAGISSAKSARR